LIISFLYCLLAKKGIILTPEFRIITKDRKSNAMSENSFKNISDKLTFKKAATANSDIRNSLFYYMSGFGAKEEHNGNYFVSTASSKNMKYVNQSSLQQMILRLLIEKGMSKKELAQVLEITIRNLERLFSDDIPPGLLAKINLPLVKLYCSTKW
jgi:hypothetical protein